MTIKEQYDLACGTPSDIYKHLPKLNEYASKCKHITEMGVRSVVSTWAFLLAGPKKVVCYDMERSKNVDNAELCAIDANIEFEFHEKNVLKVEIEETDFLFIDTFHTASQLKKELELHSDKAKMYIGFHDTETFWEKAEPPYSGMKGKVDTKGLRYALEPFLANNKNWVIDYQSKENNGLTIIKRVG